MQTDSVELSFLSIFAFITFFIFLIVSKYSYKVNDSVLLDKDFSKPQSFHDEEISRSGGIASIISLFTFFGIYYLLFSFFSCHFIFLLIKIMPYRYHTYIKYYKAQRYPIFS